MLRPLLIAALLASAAFAGPTQANPYPRVLTGKSSPAPTPPPPPAPPPAPAPAPRHEHRHRHRDFDGRRFGWVPVRTYQTLAEVRLEGPGPVAPVDEPGPLVQALIGNWHLTLPVLTVAEDGYGRFDTVREDADLGELSIRADGSFEWDVPGQLRSGGSLTEVTADYAPPEARFWTFEGQGRTLVLALTEDGLLVYDTGNNQFFARGTR